MAERPNFKKAPAADAKKQGFIGKMFSRIKEKLKAIEEKEDEKVIKLTLRQMWLNSLYRRSHAPTRKNGVREMTRRVRQIRCGTTVRTSCSTGSSRQHSKYAINAEHDERIINAKIPRQRD